MGKVIQAAPSSRPCRIWTCDLRWWPHGPQPKDDVRSHSCQGLPNDPAYTALVTQAPVPSELVSARNL